MYSVAKKLLVAITGFFLLVFLPVHLGGNLLLLVGKEAFNRYAHFMATSGWIRVAEILLFIAILVHIYYALKVTIENLQARPQRYKWNRASENSSLFSRIMPISGAIILVFLIIHLNSFLINGRWGSNVPTMMIDGMQVKDLYTVVATAFQSPVYVIIYELSFLFLGFHLVHGVYSAFQTTGLIINRGIRRFVMILGYLYAILIPVGYAIIPIYFLLNGIK